MRRHLVIGLAAMSVASPALARRFDPAMVGMQMSHMTQPALPLAKPKGVRRGRLSRVRRHKGPAIAVSRTMLKMDGAMVMPGDGRSNAQDGGAAGRPMEPHQAMAGMPPPSGASVAHPGMAGMTMPSDPATPPPREAMAGMQMNPLPDGSGPPATPRDHAADRDFSPAVMAAARRELAREHGNDVYTLAMANLLEYQARDGGAYRWDGEASTGGDINRLVLKSEGEGDGARGVEAAEVQALFGRAVSPYFNLQAGVRRDLNHASGRTYATLGFEGLAPYWFEVSGAVFLSTRGEVLGRLEGDYDQRLTQRLILQPRVEVNIAAQNSFGAGIGAGVSNVEAGLRLRYEITRQFAPYVGLSFDRKLGCTADYARARGSGPGGTTLVAGVRTWF